MNEPRESGERVISVGGHIHDLVHGLRLLQGRLWTTLAEVNALLDDAEFLLAAHATPEAEELAHLRQYGEPGGIVMRVAKQHGVPLRLLLGPGAPATNKARAARLAAIEALGASGQTNAEIASLLRISYESIRQKRAWLKTARPHKAVA